MMTHVCQLWRIFLLSTPSLWTQLDFSTPNSKQAVGLLGRSENQPFDIYQAFGSNDEVEPFLSTALHNIYRLRQLEIISSLPQLWRMLTQFTNSAPELKRLRISNNLAVTGRDLGLPDTNFKGHLPKLTSLSLHYLRTNFHAFNCPSLTQFNFVTISNMELQDLTSFFERCPSLEFIQISLSILQPPRDPPHKRTLLAALKELRFDQAAVSPASSITSPFQSVQR